MRSNPRRRLLLHQLQEGLPGITEVWGSLLAEAAIMCFDTNKHRTGVGLIVEGIASEVFEVEWETEITEQMRWAWEDDVEATQFGACTVAILLTLELTPYTVIRRARIGTRVDYWLGYKDAQHPFQDAARLEVSGILRGDTSVISSRMNEKIQRLGLSSNNLPTYVVVVEFSKPLSRILEQ